MNFKRNGSAKWSGGFKDGRGSISTESGALQEHPYGYSNRFGNVKGTNPEELIGAAHAACFNMAFAINLGEANFKAESLETTANVTLEQKNGGFEISKIDLKLKGRVPGMNSSQFQELANKAKEGCPVSKLLKAQISLEAQLEESPNPRDEVNSFV